MLFADIVVFAPTDPTKHFFTYRVPKKLSKSIVTGQLVSVPWGKKESLGIIVEIKKETQVLNPKPIKKILLTTPLLLPNYTELLKWMSWYYHAPMLDCLQAMLPEGPRNAKRLMTNANFDSKSISHSALDVEQTLILFPNINQISSFSGNQKLSKGILIYNKQLARKQIWKGWWQVYHGAASKIIGTRSALFTQCPNLTEIKIINEEDPGFKDERSPYFDTLTVADKLAKLTGAKLKIETFTPRVETYFNFGKKLIKRRIKNKPKITVANLFQERKQRSRSNISDILRNLLIDKIRQNKPVLFFLNRLKESGQVYCAECKFSGYSPTTPEFCPNCKGPNFNFFSFNLRSVGQQVEKLVPSVGLKLVTEGGSTVLKDGSPKVFLATSAIFSQSPPKFSLVGIISADTILNLPDFNSTFRTFATIVKLSQLADKDGQVLIQTYNPQHLAVKSLANFDFEKFYQEELILRKKLELPPFFILAKLSVRLRNPEKARIEAEKLVRILERKSLLVEISEPIQNWQSKPEFNIILKAKNREDLDGVLIHTPSKWKVVIDPQTLL